MFSLLAQLAPVPPIIPDDATITVAPWVYAVIVGLISPLLTGLLTKITASSPTKAVVNAALVAVAAVVGQIIMGSGSFALQNTLVMAATIFVVNVASYHGIIRPTVGPNALAPEFGIGPSTTTT